VHQRPPWIHPVSFSCSPVHGRIGEDESRRASRRASKQAGAKGKWGGRQGGRTAPLWPHASRCRRAFPRQRALLLRGEAGVPFLRPTLPSTFRESERGGVEGAATDLAVRHVSYTRTRAHTHAHAHTKCMASSLTPCALPARLLSWRTANTCAPQRDQLLWLRLGTADRKRCQGFGLQALQALQLKVAPHMKELKFAHTRTHTRTHAQTSQREIERCSHTMMVNSQETPQC